MKHNIIIYILFFILVIFQVAFLGNFSFFLLRFNLIIVGLVLLLNLLKFERFLPVALLSGVVLDLYSSLPFGVYALTMLVTFVILEILFVNFFTNHSLYSIVLLGVIATVVYNLIFLLLNGLMYLLNFGNVIVGQVYLLNFIWQIFDNAVILIICFYLINSISKRFKPIFLKS